MARWESRLPEAAGATLDAELSRKRRESNVPENPAKADYLMSLQRQRSVGADTKVSGRVCVKRCRVSLGTDATFRPQRPIVNLLPARAQRARTSIGLRVRRELAVELASSDQVALTRNSADAVIDMKIL